VCEVLPNSLISNQAACYNSRMPKSKVPAEVSEYMKALAAKSWAKRKKTQDMAATGKKGLESRWGKKEDAKPQAKKEKPTKPHATKKKSSLDMPYEP
jgi:hypothetical protein